MCTTLIYSSSSYSCSFLFSSASLLLFMTAKSLRLHPPRARRGLPPHLLRARLEDEVYSERLLRPPQNSGSCHAPWTPPTPSYLSRRLGHMSPPRRITPRGMETDRGSSSWARHCSTSAAARRGRWRRAPDSTHTALFAANFPLAVKMPPRHHGGRQLFRSRPFRRHHEPASPHETAMPKTYILILVTYPVSIISPELLQRHSPVVLLDSAHTITGDCAEHDMLYL